MDIEDVVWTVLFILHPWIWAIAFFGLLGKNAEAHADELWNMAWKAIPYAVLVLLILWWWFN